MTTSQQKFSSLIAQGPITIRQARVHMEQLIAACQAEGVDTSSIATLPAELARLETQVKDFTSRIRPGYRLHEES